MYTEHFISEDEHERWFAGVHSDPTRMYWIILLGIHPVGLVYLHDLDRANRRTQWGFYIGSTSARGKGVGTLVEYAVLDFVFEELKFNKLCGEVLSHNKAVLKLHESFGFRLEGRLRQHVVKDGIFHDVIMIAMLRDEWRRERPHIEERLKSRGLSFEPGMLTVATIP